MATPKKPVPRAVLEAQLKSIEDRRFRRREFAVKFGVYIALIIGVLASQVVVMAGDLRVALQPIEFGQMGGSMIVAGALYNKMEDNGDTEGKIKNVSRLLRNALYHGFFWMSILGAWW